MAAILQALQNDRGKSPPELVIGMDGNTYKHHSEQGVADFQKMLATTQD
jgi:hypothetical protein